MALGFYPPNTWEVIRMTDYEMLAIVIAIISLAFMAHNHDHKS